MPKGQILASDAFTRANGGLGSLYTTITGMGAPQVNTNAVRTNAVGTDSKAKFTGCAWPDDQYAEVTPITTAATATGSGPVCRCASAAASFYSASSDTNFPVLTIARYDTGSSTTLSATSKTLVSGQKLRLETEGTTLRAYINDTLQYGPTTDSTYANGSAGLHIYVDTGTTASEVVDNFEGGTLTGPMLFRGRPNPGTGPMVLRRQRPSWLPIPVETHDWNTNFVFPTYPHGIGPSVLRRKNRRQYVPPDVVVPSVVTVALTGTAAASITEADIVAGGKTIILTLTNDTWVASGAAFDAIRQDIINGLDSAQAEAAGWDAVVKATQAVTGVVRTSDTIVTITLDAFGTYDITATETITATVPATALNRAQAVIATPTFTISAVGAGAFSSGWTRATYVVGTGVF